MSLFFSTPTGAPPLWAVLEAQVWCGFFLLICHILLPLVTIMILLSSLSEEVVILPPFQKKEWDVEGVLFGLHGLKLAD